MIMKLEGILEPQQNLQSAFECTSII